MHRWNEGIILSHISHILDVLLPRTGCCRRLTDSTPAWLCDHLENMDPHRRHELVAWGAVWIRLNHNCMAWSPGFHSASLACILSLQRNCLSGHGVISHRPSVWRSACRPASRPFGWGVQINVCPCCSPGANCCCNRSAMAGSRASACSTPASTPRTTARNSRSVADEHRPAFRTH